jgi:hypothetical protein
MPVRNAVPEELKQLDNAAIASVQPERNEIDGAGAKIVRGKETANSVEFNLHQDGTLMKFMERPGYAPQCLLVDGAGRQFGVVRNAEVADLICNGVNALHLAHVMQAAEQAEKVRAANPGGEPPALLLPGGGTGLPGGIL